jgi:hypothetical protein
MRITLLVSAFLLFSFAGLPLLAFAEEKKFTDFTLNVPESCSAEENQSLLSIRCHDTSFFALSLRPSGPKGGREAADEFARRYKGNTPMLNEYGNYFFDTEQNGISTKVELIERDKLLLVYMSDNNPDGWPEALSKAFDSITGNTPAIDDFVKKYLLSPPDEQP